MSEAATPNPCLDRYEHGGGRLWLPGRPRKLVADFYHEEDREFYTRARSLVPELVERLERAERDNEQLRETLAEAYHYVCAWPIGTTDEPQEQRGGPRDTMLANLNEALAAHQPEAEEA